MIKVTRVLYMKFGVLSCFLAACESMWRVVLLASNLEILRSETPLRASSYNSSYKNRQVEIVLIFT